MAAAGTTTQEPDDLDLSLLAIAADAGVHVVDATGKPVLAVGAVPESKSGDEDHDIVVTGCTVLKQCVFGQSEIKALAVKRGGVNTLAAALTSELSGDSNEARISSLCSCIQSFALKARVDTMAALLEADMFASLATCLQHGADTTSKEIVDSAAGAALTMITPPAVDVLEAARASGIQKAAAAARDALTAAGKSAKCCVFLLMLLESSSS